MGDRLHNQRYTVKVSLPLMIVRVIGIPPKLALNTTVMMTIYLMGILGGKPLMIILQSLKRLTAKVKLEAVRFPMAHRLGGSGAPEVREKFIVIMLMWYERRFSF